MYMGWSARLLIMRGIKMLVIDLFLCFLWMYIFRDLFPAAAIVNFISIKFSPWLLLYLREQIVDVHMFLQLIFLLLFYL